MNLDIFVAVLVVGLVAGTLASLFVRHGSFGILGDVLVGVCGALIMAYLVPTIGISLGGGMTGALILASIGAVGTLGIFRKLKTA